MLVELGKEGTTVLAKRAKQFKKLQKQVAVDADQS